MPLSKTVNKKLNEQVVNELHASHTYLMMSAYFDDLELSALTKFFRDQATEEHEHAMKILDYVLEGGGELEIGAVAAPPKSFESVLALAKAALQHEEKVTAQIHDIVRVAEEENDYATRSFLQWFVDEQVEEVATMTKLAQLAKHAGDRLLQLDSYVARNLSEEE